ncbi:hypothetical protein MVEN_01715100 [Mycena venus]|uniref:CxC1-like cysteine cluster associated with KDZ transposases domain-containing protein n=1 Tax=Mycena venus TaxID=2733690 RepID=A0A8H6XPS3_9AGAR|nr:hypothetical protein MVEN_01715100 [Mycena venus]
MSSLKAARAGNRLSATLLSSSVHVTTSCHLDSGRIAKEQRSLTLTKIRLSKAEEARKEAERLEDRTDLFDDCDDFEQDVLHGRAAADISHAGKVLPSDEADCADADVMAGLRANHKQLWGRYSDTRTRKNRTQQQINAFEVQIKRMADAYLAFSLAIADDGLVASPRIPENTSVQETRKLLVVDMFSASHQGLKMIGSDAYIALACVRSGWMPCVAYFPTVVITIRALEVYPLCDIHGVAPRPWLGTQFSVAFDVYLAVRVRVDKRLEVALGRDALDWRLKNACASKELPDNCVAPGDYYLSHEEVDKWAKEGVTDVMKSFSPEAGDDEESGYTERWQNMKEEVTVRVYGMYDETGFPALCCHGFVLKVVDMIKSGELSKYPLAITAHLLNILGEIAIGYDIGCKFGKMVKVHPALKELAADKNFHALVGAFHGHGHGRLCGLDKPHDSNALASTTCYASRFHRQQAITTYLKHVNTFETYQGLSLLLCSKYKRALEIKATETTLRATMRELGVESQDVFEMWRAREKAHLCTLSKEPEEETLEMEYLQKLINLREAQERVGAILGVQVPFVPAETDASYAEAAKAMRRIEMQRWHALEVEVLPLCYKLRKHIAKSLQARSKAVKTAISRYNEAAEAMTPPKPTLDWEEVVEYAFRADFDLLREGREDIRGELWAQPAGRAVMDQHFKLLRADEEIRRLNVEICRFVTYIRDEEMECARFTALHTSRLLKLSKVPGCTANILPGNSVSRERHTPVTRDRDVEMHAPSPLPDPDAAGIPPPPEDEDVPSDDDEDGTLADAFLNIQALRQTLAASPQVAAPTRAPERFRMDACPRLVMKISRMPLRGCTPAKAGGNLGKPSMLQLGMPT